MKADFRVAMIHLCNSLHQVLLSFHQHTSAKWQCQDNEKMKENGKEGEGWFSLFPGYSHSFSLSFTFSGQSPGLLIVSLHLTSFATEALWDSLIIQA